VELNEKARAKGPQPEVIRESVRRVINMQRVAQLCGCCGWIEYG